LNLVLRPASANADFKSEVVDVAWEAEVGLLDEPIVHCFRIMTWVVRTPITVSDTKFVVLPAISKLPKSAEKY
jgi:hypothetical protein